VSRTAAWPRSRRGLVSHVRSVSPGL